MAEAHHDDHGNTPAAWFLTVSWLVIWTAGAAAIILGYSLILWTLITLGASAVTGIIAGLMKRAGLGRTEPRQWVATPQEGGEEPAPQREAAKV